MSKNKNLPAKPRKRTRIQWRVFETGRFIAKADALKMAADLVVEVVIPKEGLIKDVYVENLSVCAVI